VVLFFTLPESFFGRLDDGGEDDDVFFGRLDDGGGDDDVEADDDDLTSADDFFCNFSL